MLSQNRAENSSSESQTQKTPEIADLYQVHHFIDANDTDGAWRVGFIVQKNEKTKYYKIRFDGWSAKWDETYKETSAKLRHFRTVTIGYTGQKTEQALRQSWKYTLVDHQQRLDRLKIVLAPSWNCSSLSAFEITQYFRGSHYLYIDFLFCSTFIDSLEMAGVVEYFRLHLQLLQRHLRQIDASFKQYYKALDTKEESIIVNSQSAYVHSTYEILDGAVNILGGYPRNAPFYKANRKELLDLLEDSVNEKDPSVEDFIKILFLREFQVNQGLKTIEEFLGKLAEQATIAPFSILKALAQLVSQLCRLLDFKLMQQSCDLIFKIIDRNFNKITDKEIKQMDRTVIADVLTQVKFIFLRHPEREVLTKDLETKELQLSNKYFKSPFFEKKIKGIVSLKESLEEIIKLKTFMTPNQFLEWANNSHFLTEVFGDSTHQQIIKKGGDIVKMLSINNLLKKDVLDLIWNARKGKHEAVVQEIDNLIIELAAQMPQELLEHVYTHIKSQPLSSWDDAYMDLVKQFTMKAVKSTKSKDNNFGLELIYEFSTMKQNEKTLDAFFELIRLPVFQSQLEQYRDICLQNIKVGLSPYFHVCLLLKIQNDPLIHLASSANMIDILVADLLKESSKVDQLDNRFKLIDAVSTSYPSQALQSKHFDKIWDHFKNNSHPGEQKFSHWLCYEGEKEYKVNPSLSDELRQYIFKEILCNHKKNDFLCLNIHDCETILCFMVVVNSHYFKFQKVRSCNVYLVNTQQILGVSQLWHIFLNNRNDQVVRKIADVICNLALRLTQKLQAQVGDEKAVKLVQKCMEYIISANQKHNYKLVNRCLMLLLRLFAKIEGQYDVTPNVKPRFTNQFGIPVINSDTQERKTVPFNVSQPFGALRQEICKTFNKHISQFMLTTKAGLTIGREMDSVPYLECSITLPLTFTAIEVGPCAVKSEMNKHLELLFSLLSSQCSDMVWQLLSRLPSSPNFKINEIDNWDTLLSGGIYKQLYVLRLISNMSKEQFDTTFVMKNGAATLFDRLKKCSSIQSPIELDYMKTLLKLTVRLDIKNDTEILKEVFKCLISLCEVVSKEQESEGERINLEYEAMENCLILLQNINKQDKKLSILMQDGKLSRIIRLGILEINQKKIKDSLCLRLARMILDQQNVEAEEIKQILVFCLTDILNLAVEKKNNVYSLFSFCASVIQQVRTAVVEGVRQEIPNLPKILEEMLRKSPQQPSNRESSDCLWGLAHTYRAFITRKDITKIEGSDGFVKFLLQECLFPQSGQHRHPKAKAYRSRMSLLRLLLALMWQSENNFLQTLDYMSRFHREGQWRTKRLVDWSISPKLNEKSITGYVGLKNLGCICYMNSILQQMFMIPSFRQAVMDVDDPQLDKVPKQDNLLYNLKTLFLALQKSQQQYFNPKSFCHAFKGYDGKPINTSEQMDIDEFSGLLFDKLQNQVRESTRKDFIKEHFGCIVSNEVISKGCNHISEREQQFLNIPLEVKNKKNIYMSFQTMIKGELLEGDNAYHCDRCNKKVPAVKRMCIKKLPNHLIVVLKRFEFNYDKMAKVKINDHCEFPMELDLMPYSQQYLRNKQGKMHQDETEYPPEYYQYDLKGVVIHLGSADSGHYYSYIQKRGERDAEWLQFNDTIVRKFNVENLPNEAFGGEEKSYTLTKEKIRNAYVLIYDRKQCFDNNGNKIVEKQLTVNRQEPQYCSSFLRELRYENEQAELEQLLFSKEYYDFVMECLKSNNPTPTPFCNEQLNKFSFLFMVTRIIREKDRKSSSEFVTMIKRQINESLSFCRWIMDSISDQNIFNELLKNNPARDVRKSLAHLIIHVCQRLYAEEAEGANNQLFAESEGDHPYPMTRIANFINCILSTFKEKFISSSNELFLILTRLCQIGFEISDYLLEKHAFALILENLLEKNPATLSGQLTFSTKPKNGNLGSSVEAEQKQTIYEALMARKARLDFDRTYMWYLLSELLRHVDLKKKNDYPQYFTQTRHDLSIAQRTLLYLSGAAIYENLQKNKNKLMIRKICQYATLLCVEDQKYSQDMSKIIGKALKALENTKFRPFFVLFKQLVGIQDHLLAKRLEYVGEIKAGLEENKKYFMENNITQQWLLKTVRKNKKLADHLRVYDVIIRSILDYIRDKDSPADELARKNSPPCERLRHCTHGVQILQSSAAYKQLSKLMVEEFTNILQNTPYEHKLGSLEWDSDDDLTDKELKENQVVNYFVQTGDCTFVDATVESQNYGLLSIRLKTTGEVMSVWKDDDSLAEKHSVCRIVTQSKQVESQYSEGSTSQENDYYGPVA